MLVVSDLHKLEISKVRRFAECSAIPPQMANSGILSPHRTQFPSLVLSLLCALLGVQTPSARMVCRAPAFIGSFCASFWQNLRVVASSAPLSTPL
eukprot:2250558-Heterocapsa_arctica.AAC.1